MNWLIIITVIAIVTLIKTRKKMRNYNEQDNEVLKSAGVVINWAIRTVMKVILWTIGISIVISCLSIAISKTVKTERRTEINTSK